jgi:starch phosphorylase
MLEEFLHAPRVAYFSMEIALRSDIPTYTGGLGILAGDTIRSAADLGLPLVAVSLVSQSGHLRQSIDRDGRQIEVPSAWEPARWARPLNAKIAVTIESRQVWIGAWLYLLEGQAGGRQPVLLLDSALDDNRPEDRGITSELYGGDDALRLKQEIVLGIGGMRMLQALGFEIRRYHMNEGHSALLGLELLRRFAYSPGEMRPGESLYNVPAVRRRCCFTTHTPVEAGHDHFSYDIVQRILAPAGSGEPPTSEQVIDLPMLRRLGGQDELNMTRLALNLSDYVNGVARRHAELSERMFPGYRMHAISNGVHPLTWTCASFRKLYDRYLPGWSHEPELLVRADCCLPDGAILEAHAEAKQVLIDRVRALSGVVMRPDVPLLGFARRMTAYKRPDLLFSDVTRLRAIARKHAFQIVLAGKAHPRDADGKRLIAELHAYVRALADSLAIVYLADYDMALAQLVVAGTDVWLNTPLPPQEASGTSGMKAALNGVPSLSVLDGWWIDGCIEGVTGWAIGAGGRSDGDAVALYDKLEQVVLPLYCGDGSDRSGWLRVMKGAISKNGAYFSSHRMMRRYATEAYLG